MPALPWILTIARLNPFIVGITWIDMGDPFVGISIVEADLYQDVQTILDSVPLHLTDLYFELNDSLKMIMKDPSLSA